VWFEHTPSYVVMLLIIVAFFNLRFFSNSKWLRSAENELCQDIHFLNRFNETILFQTLSGIKSACPLI
jgi:type II secretory pathway component PulF